MRTHLYPYRYILVGISHFNGLFYPPYNSSIIANCFASLIVELLSCQRLCCARLIMRIILKLLFVFSSLPSYYKCFAKYANRFVSSSWKTL